MKSRIHITYDIEENGSTIKKSLPFSIGIVGDLTGNASPYNQTSIEDRAFIPVNQHSINSVMKQLSPRLTFNIEFENHGEKKVLPINLDFNSLDDFKPTSIIQQVPLLKRLWQLRQQLKQLQIEDTMKHESIDEPLNKLIQDFKDEVEK